MKITSTRTVKITVDVTVDLAEKAAHELVKALSEALTGASIRMINDGSVDALCALRDGLQDELMRNNPR